METDDKVICLVILIASVLGVATSSPFSLFVLASTEDDGYVYPEDASDEEKEEIDKQEQEEWEDAGRPGEDDDNYNDNESDEELYECPDGSLVPLDSARCPNLSELELKQLEEAILNDPTAPDWLPACDGSYQDCVTENGDVCVAGSTVHECELPNPGDEIISPGIPFPEVDEGNDKPNPYCDLLPDGFRSVTCHDRKDYDEDTGLYTCNDGTHKVGWQDCPDVSGYDYEKGDTIGQLEPDISQPDIQIGPEKNETYEPMHTGKFGNENEWNRNCFDQGITDSQKGEYSEETAERCGDFAQGKKSYDQGFNAGSVRL